MFNFKSVHLMGIGGAGMSALAKILRFRGIEVTGCDLKQSYYDLDGISCSIGHSPEHLDSQPDALILSSAVRRDNPEVLRAAQLGIPVLSRAEALSDLFNGFKGVGIAGAHGKTTTSSMTGLVFLRAGLDPTIYIGANVPDLGGNALCGRGEFFVAELDESDGTFELFRPCTSIITNADWDHVDHYKTRQDVIEAFTRFADGRRGTLVLCGEDEGAQEVYRRCDKAIGSVLRYGFGRAWDWGAVDIRQTCSGVSFTVIHEGKELGRLELHVTGRHNVLNSLAATAAACANGIDWAVCALALGEFQGCERRMQIKGTTDDGVLVMDDYAHHPAEIAATLGALRDVYPQRRILVVYQPHRFSRTAMFALDFARALSRADEIFLMPVYSAGEQQILHSTSLEILQHCTRPATPVDFGNVLEALRAEMRPGDLLLTMGAGDVYKVGLAVLGYN